MCARLAVVFDDQHRPETTGGYCRRALDGLAQVQHFLPADLGAIPRSGFDLYLRIDDGLGYQLPADLRPSAWWAIDTHLGFDRCLAQARACDLTFAAQRDGAADLRRAGIATAAWLPLACDPAIHRRHAVPKQFDVAFVGNLFPVRSDLLELIRRRHPNTFVGNRYFDEMAKTYSAARAVFNRSITNDVNMRVFEALACGSLLVTNDLADNGQAELFRDGVHLAAYRDPDELLDKLRFYLTHPDARRKVEDAGMREAAAKHTYRLRMQAILAAADRLPVSVPVASPTPVPAGYVPDYYEFDRPELLALVPPDARDVLDVGCGAGRFGAALKARQPCRVTGLELDPAAAAAARARLDAVHHGDIEAAPPPLPDGAFDAVVCGDVLEHLRDPLAFLRRVRGWLRPTGRLVVSVPNVQHHTVVSGLLAGNWTYEAAGLLDRTHLRFFTRREVQKLLRRAGFAPDPLGVVPGPGYEEWAAAGRPGTVKVGRLHIGGLAPAAAEEFYTYQFLATARPDPPPDHGLTSVVILTHNQLPYTRRCVDSLRLVTDEPIELIFVDNGSTDGTPDYLRALAAADPRVKVILNPDNRGFPAGANQGIAAATGSQVLLLNNDTVVTTGWLGRLLHALHADPKVGLVGPCSDHVSGEQRVPADFGAIEELDGFAWDWGLAHDRRAAATDRLVGFCLLIKRAVIEQIGGLDERFGVGCFEDDDYCRRALAAGFRAVIAQDVFIHHAGGATFRGSGVDFAALMRENAMRYDAKWAAAAPDPAFDLELGPDGGLRLVPAARPAAAPGRPDVQLSLCMIVRNNEGTIRATLESIRPWVDEIIVVDTGSTDRTPEICRELGATVYHFAWCDDFSAARNESIKYARGRWIFWMDSDDTIDERNGRALRELAYGPHDPNIFGYMIAVHCPGRHPDDDMTVVDHVKLFRNLPELRFEHCIHEQILMPIRAAGGDVKLTDLFVTHSGYDHSPAGQQHKKERDFRCLAKDLAKRPNHPFVLFNYGMTHHSFGEHEQAVTWLRRSIEHSQPENSHLRKVYALLAGSLALLDRPAEALRACDDGLKLFPLDAELRFRRARALHDLHKLNAAVAAYEDLLANAEERHPGSVECGLRGYKARQNLALVLEEIGDLAGAVAQWRAVTAEVPGYRPGWRGLGEALLKAGRAAEVEAVAAGLAGDPRLAGEGAVLAVRAAGRRGDPAAARRALEAAVGRHAHDAEVLRDLARLMFDGRDPAAAEAVLERLVAAAPDDAGAWHNLGAAKAAQGRRGDALAAFRRALELQPDVPLTLVELGHSLSAAGRAGEAAQQWRRALEVSPGYEPAVQALKDAGHRP